MEDLPPHQSKKTPNPLHQSQSPASEFLSPPPSPPPPTIFHSLPLNSLYEILKSKKVLEILNNKRVNIQGYLKKLFVCSAHFTRIDI